MTTKTTPIDPRTTRRTITLDHFEKNSALWAQYRVLAYTQSGVLLEKKPEFCQRRGQNELQTG